MVCQLGKPFRYYSEIEKYILIAKPWSIANVESLSTLYQHSFDMHQGSRILGNLIGTQEETDDWVDGKISGWIEAINSLKTIAYITPQSICAGFQHYLQC